MEKNKQIKSLLKDLPVIPKVKDWDIWHIEHHNHIAEVLNHIISHIWKTKATDITIHQYLERLSGMIASYHKSIKNLENTIESLIQRETVVKVVKQKCTATWKEWQLFEVPIDLLYDKEYVVIIDEVEVSDSDEFFYAIVPKIQKIKKWENIEFSVFWKEWEKSSWVVTFKVLAITI